jgi:hypothetical protein
MKNKSASAIGFIVLLLGIIVFQVSDMQVVQNEANIFKSISGFLKNINTTSEKKQIKITGEVVTLVLDDFDGGSSREELYFTTPAFTKKIIAQDDDLLIRLQQAKEIQVSEDIIGEDSLMLRSSSDFTVTKSASLEFQKNNEDDVVWDGQYSILVIPVHPLNPRYEPEDLSLTPEEIHEHIFQESLPEYFEEVSSGRFSLIGDVHPWVNSQQSCNNINMTSNLDLEISDEYDLESYDFIHFLYNCGYLGGFTAGFASLNEVTFQFPGATFQSRGFVTGVIDRLVEEESFPAWGSSHLDYDYDIDTQIEDWSYFDFLVAHELGHALGMSHSRSAIYCGDNLPVTLFGICQNIEYGNWYDVMGNGVLAAHYSNFQKDALGWIDEESKMTVTNSGVYTLYSEISDGGVSYIEIPHPTLEQYSLVVELREPVGFDAVTAQEGYIYHDLAPGYMNSGLHLYISDTWKTWQIGANGTFSEPGMELYGFFASPLMPGEDIAIPDYGVTIKNLLQNPDGSLEVEVVFDDISEDSCSYDIDMINIQPMIVMYQAQGDDSIIFQTTDVDHIDKTITFYISDEYQDYLTDSELYNESSRFTFSAQYLYSGIGCPSIDPQINIVALDDTSSGFSIFDQNYNALLDIYETIQYWFIIDYLGQGVVMQDISSIELEIADALTNEIIATDEWQIEYVFFEEPEVCDGAVDIEYTGDEILYEMSEGSGWTIPFEIDNNSTCDAFLQSLLFEIYPEIELEDSLDLQVALFVDNEEVEVGVEYGMQGSEIGLFIEFEEPLLSVGSGQGLGHELVLIIGGSQSVYTGIGTALIYVGPTGSLPSFPQYAWQDFDVQLRPFIVCQSYDLNNDGIVGSGDLTSLLSSFGQAGVSLAGDINGDQVVNIADLALLLQNYGQECDGAMVETWVEGSFVDIVEPQLLSGTNQQYNVVINVAPDYADETMSLNNVLEVEYSFANTSGVSVKNGHIFDFSGVDAGREVKIYSKIMLPDNICQDLSSKILTRYELCE